MARVKTSVDYYKVLEVDDTADTPTIIKSYKRLALLHHPDKNRGQDTTAAFQLLGEAYEILKDNDKRRLYDLNYSRATNSYPASGGKAASSAPFTASSEQEDISQETAEIASILKAKAERAERWSKTQKAYSDAILNLEREIQKLQIAIKGLDEIDKAEDAEKAVANSWKTWLLSPIYQARVQTEEEKESKARERLQRLHSRNSKETDLKKRNAELKDYHTLLKTKWIEFELANKKDEASKVGAEERVRAKRQRAQQEREKREATERARAWQEHYERQQREAAKAAKERQEKQQKEVAERKAREEKQRREAEENARFWEEYWEKRRKEAEESARKQMEEEEELRAENLRKSQQRQEQESQRKAPKRNKNQGPTSKRAGPSTKSNHASRGACAHHGWWSKVEGHHTCSKCSASHYSYLLECPGCKMKACAACQKQIRQNRKQSRSRNDHRA